MIRKVFIVFTCTLIVACIPEKSEIPAGQDSLAETQLVAESEPSEESLFAEWSNLARDPEARLGSMRPFQICDQLSKMDATALSPILDLLGAETTDDGLKVYILQSINANMTSAYLPQLLSLLDSDQPTTRSCATTLLGSIGDPAVVEHLEKLRHDDDSRVAFSALSGLAQRAPDEYRDEFVNIYFHDATATARKTEVMRVVIVDPQESDVPVLEAQVSDPESEYGLRTVSAIILGSLGNLDSIPALEKGIELSGDDQFKQMALSTIAAIQERFKA